jgi:hypothetical protein
MTAFRPPARLLAKYESKFGRPWRGVVAEPKKKATKRAKPQALKRLPKGKQFDRKELMREIERDRRAKVSERLAELRALISAAKEHRREAVKTIKTQCRVARAKLKTVCARREAEAKDRGAAVVLARQSDHSEAKREDLGIRRTDRRNVKQDRGTRTRTERKSESDDEVRKGLAPGLVKVWEKVKRHIKASAHRSRLEAFLEWAQENPDEVFTIQHGDTDREVARLISERVELERAQHAANANAARGPGVRSAKARKRSFERSFRTRKRSAAVAGVPF